MASALGALTLPDPWRAAPFAALFAMYVPTLYSLLDNGLWSSSEHGHGPIVLLVCLWLLWKRWGDARPRIVEAPRPRLAWILLALGALMFLVGRILDVVYTEVGSVIPILAGLLLLQYGSGALRILSFPIFFMVFMVPLPGFIVDPVGQFMKTVVSMSAEAVLHQAGYPIARSGVVLQLGQYQLLVADACAGMRTLFMLEALGILYLNLVRYSSWTRNVVLALLIVPISFTANIIRVLVLALVTYYLGDEAGQGFLHGFAGMVLFLTALGLIIVFDGMLRKAAPVASAGAA